MFNQMLLCMVASSVCPAETAYDIKSYQEDQSTFVYYEAMIQLPRTQKGYWRVDKSRCPFIRDIMLEFNPTGIEYTGDEDSNQFRVTCMMEHAPKTSVDLYFHVPGTSERVQVTWDLSSAHEGDRDLWERMAKRRHFEWQDYHSKSGSPILKIWLSIRDDVESWYFRDTKDSDEGTSFLNILGGRAAVRETLQMQAIDDELDSDGGSIPIQTLSGVQVESLPFDDMLEGKERVSLDMAGFVPQDRLFVYVKDPQSLDSVIEKGGAFISETGNMLWGSGVCYDLKDRYLKRLGMNEDLLAAIVSSGMMKETVVMAPDLFFIDGTDITIIARISGDKALDYLWKTMCAAHSRAKGIVESINARGDSVYMMEMDGYVVISTSLKEISAVQALMTGMQDNSLGASAEFRYMLATLPLNSETKMYAYLSDPFIRHLAGPRVKIAQLRRLKEKSRMETLTSAMLLAKGDGVKHYYSLKTLVEKGYISKAYLDRVYTIDSELTVHSETFGSLAHLVSLDGVDVDQISEEEAEAYREYVERYQEFWSQFFDPMAYRLDEVHPGDFESTLFVLPLIDSSFYQGLKGALATESDGETLNRPVFSQEPVLMYTMGLSRELLGRNSRSIVGWLRDYLPLGKEFFEDLGPSLCLALDDAAPIITMGSGDILGIFGSGMSPESLGDYMFWAPVLLSMLTRPCTLAIETRNPENTLDELTWLSSLNPDAYRSSSHGFFEVEWYHISGGNGYECVVSLTSFFKMRFTVKVNDHFLCISNQTGASNPVIRTDTVPRVGAMLSVKPQACELQKSGLFSSYTDYRMAISRRGLGLIYPIVASGYATPDHAEEALMNLYGYKPVHPRGGRWVSVDNQVKSSVYGGIHDRAKPAYTRESEDFGLFKSVRDFTVSMRFEDSGLRTTMSWKTK